MRLSRRRPQGQARGQGRVCRLAKIDAGVAVDPDSIFDCQVKRIHEYKRQLLNALRIVVLYNRLRENPDLEMAPRTFFFAGKAAPAYQLAKLIIKFINNLAGTIDADPAVRGRLKVVFLPEYCVSLAERLIPASDVSNQISTAGYEASGTSNMKFMMNGALTIGTRDGATIEMAEAAGEENLFLFGLTAEQVAGSRGWYNPHWHYENEPETRAALDLIFSGHFNRNEPGVFEPLREPLLTHGDHYMHLADLDGYLEADQQLLELYADPDAWTRKAILNVAELRAVLQRPHHRRIRRRDLGRNRARCRRGHAHVQAKIFPPPSYAGLWAYEYFRRLDQEPRGPSRETFSQRFKPLIVERRSLRSALQFTPSEVEGRSGRDDENWA